MNSSNKDYEEYLIIDGIVYDKTHCRIRYQNNDLTNIIKIEADNFYQITGEIQDIDFNGGYGYCFTIDNYSQLLQYIESGRLTHLLVEDGKIKRFKVRKDYFIKNYNIETIEIKYLNPPAWVENIFLDNKKYKGIKQLEQELNKKQTKQNKLSSKLFSNLMNNIK